MSPAGVWWFVSDLHLGAAQDRRGTAAAFAGFLEEIGDTRPEAARRVVLLGDTFDLPADDSAVGRLEAIERRHPDVFAALRRALGAGTDVDVVCGNHDTALARPVVRDALARLTSPPVAAWPAPAGGRLEVHPWMVHEPGVFHAEHGHQHHDVHRMPALLTQTVGGAAPADSLLTAWSGSARAGRWRRLEDVRLAVTAARSAERAATAAPYLALVDAEASRVGLPVAAARSLARTSRFRVVRAAVAVGYRVASRRLGTERPGAQLRKAAARVHAVLDDHGAAVPWLVFGHTHRAGTWAGAGTSEGYLNTGTWTDDVRGSGPDVGDDRLFPYVRIDAVAAGGALTTQAWLRYWSESKESGPSVDSVPSREPARPR